ncbi:MAG: hypothetical protein IJM17_01260, partial [Firmicutes bacterium]|nr:hypothetical protein [Bacillota bacterium]
NGMLDENNTPEKTLFKPNDPCRRADIVTFMYLAAENGVSAADHDHAYPYNFIGEWQDRVSMRATMTVLPHEYGNNEDLDVTVFWGGSAWEGYQWTMRAAYDELEGLLTYTDGVLKDLVYGEDGELAEETLVNEGSKGSFFMKNGDLRWEDDMEPRSLDMRFDAVEAAAPDSEMLAAEYFKAVAAVMPGTAGSSLRTASALVSAVKFAEDSDILACSAEDLRAEMLMAWESLTDDERAAFDEAFMGVAGLADQAFSDYASVKGAFEDAGVASDMEALIGDVHARLSWEKLMSHTLTLGNSDN